MSKWSHLILFFIFLFFFILICVVYLSENYLSIASVSRVVTMQSSILHLNLFVIISKVSSEDVCRGIRNVKCIKSYFCDMRVFVMFVITVCLLFLELRLMDFDSYLVFVVTMTDSSQSGSQSVN